MKQLLVILLLWSGLSASAWTLSREASVSILTSSPGGELYSLFGHTGIRVTDRANDIDVVFNYGTFDFDTKGFYFKFARGLLPYQLSCSDYRYFEASYRREKRSIFSQTLLLDSLQKQRLVDLLLENYRPENRSYLYNFLYDNCSTRVRDILEKGLGGSEATPGTSMQTEEMPSEARITEGGLRWTNRQKDKSLWNLLDEYLQRSPWVQWGIHTILGQRGNRTATPYPYMFLPDYLMYGLNTATIDHKHLAEKAQLLYEAPEQDNATPWYFAPLFIFGIGALLLIILLWKSRGKAMLNTIVLPTFLFTGLVGCLLVFLGGFTAHPITAPNWNILWANPLNLIALPFLLGKHLPRFIAIYLKIYMVLLVAALPAWVICQPAVPMPSIFLIILMLFLCLQLRAKKMHNRL